MRILVVSHDPLTRRALADLVARVPEAEVTAVAPAAALALEGTRSVPDVVLWEAGEVPGELRRLQDWRRLGAPVVALTATAEAARRLRAMGAAAVLPRGVDVPALAATLAAVLEGLSVSDPSLESPPDELLLADDAFDELTPRELEVLGLVAEGLSNKAIAVRLEIRESTVKDHVNSMLDKLGAQSRTEAVTTALRRGLIAI